MRILRKDLRHGVIQVLVQNLDDLWHLFNVIERDDLVAARTTREVKIDGVGRPSSRRMPISLTLKVEKVYFDRSVMRLRILGVVTEAREDLHIQGSHHTLNLEPGTQATIMKNRWQRHQLDRIERALVKQDPVVIVAIDFEEACVSVLQSFGLEVKALIRSRLPGKREPEKREAAIVKYYDEVLDVVTSTVKNSPGRIVIVGPGFAKDRFAVFAGKRIPEVAKRIVGVKSIGNAGEAGAYEAIRCGVLGKVLKDARAAQEVSAVEEVLRRLGGSRGDVSYGSNEVFRDAAEGAIEQIIVCDLTLREADEENRRLIDEAIRNVENRGGKVLVVSCEHEGGAKLMGLGGIAGLLRYAKHRQDSARPEYSRILF